MEVIIAVLPLIIGWTLDLLFGDPAKLPHPIVWYGKIIGYCERRFNHGKSRRLKGGLTAVSLIVVSYVATWLLLDVISPYVWLSIAAQAILVFYCLAGTTLIKEVKMVFQAVDVSLEKGRIQVGRIVGRDTANLSAQEIRTAALETLAENLSDGVVAPLFWYALLGVPGMMAYKMVNTLDSMIGYKNERYLDFGCVAAKIDDLANYIPARLTAFLMILSSGRMKLLSFVKKYGRCHASPNSGYSGSSTCRHS